MSEGSWGIVEVAGRDARKLLQGQLTQDMAAVSEARAPLAAWCNPKGRVLTVCRVLHPSPDRYWLLMPAQHVEAFARRLRLFVLRDDVRVEVLPEAWLCGALDAAQAEAIAQTLRVALPEQPDACSSSDSDAWLIRLPAGMAGFELCGRTERAAALMLPDGFEHARVRAGLPAVDLAAREAFLPQMLNLDLLGAVSFTKGCYAGQEIVARTQHLGRIKRRMIPLAASAHDDPAPGAKLYAEGAGEGRVADVRAPLLLAVVPVDGIEAEWSLDAQGERRLQRLPLPYPLPGAPPGAENTAP